MTTTVRLDAKAVRVLIEDSPEFKFELQRAVIAEITGKLYTSYVHDDISKVVKSLFKGHEDDLVLAIQNDHEFRDRLAKAFTDKIASYSSYKYGRGQFKMNEEFARLLNEKAREISAEIADEKALFIKQRIVEIAEKSIENMSSNMQETVDRRVRAIVSENIDSEVRRRVSETLKAAFETTKHSGIETPQG